MASSGSSMLAILRDSLKQGWNRVPQTKTVAPHRGVATSTTTTGTSMNANSNPSFEPEQEQHQNTCTDINVGAKEHKQQAYTTSSPSSSPSRLLWEDAHGFDSYDGFGPWLWFP